MLGVAVFVVFSAVFLIVIVSPTHGALQQKSQSVMAEIVQRPPLRQLVGAPF